MWVHGGGWVTGDKARLNAKRAWARAHGWTLVSVNYRLTDVDDPPSRRIQYPTHNRDVGRAVNWVVDHIVPLGGDPDRIALVGHSAGAQIVSSVGTDERYLHRRAAELCGVVSLDTEGYDVAARIRAGDRGARLYRAVFGNRPGRVGRRLTDQPRRRRRPARAGRASRAPSHRQRGQADVRHGAPRRGRADDRRPDARLHATATSTACWATPPTTS